MQEELASHKACQPLQITAQLCTPHYLPPREGKPPVIPASSTGAPLFSRKHSNKSRSSTTLAPDFTLPGKTSFFDNTYLANWILRGIAPAQCRKTNQVKPVLRGKKESTNTIFYRSAIVTDQTAKSRYDCATTSN